MVRKLSYSPVVLVALVACHLAFHHVSVGFCQETTAADITAQIHAYKAELSVDGTRIETRLQLAKVYLQIEAYTEAVDEYRRIIALMEVNPVSESEGTGRKADIAAGLLRIGIGLCRT